MKKSSVAGLPTGLFNTRVLRAAALLPALSAVALRAGDVPVVPAKPEPVAAAKSAPEANSVSSPESGDKKLPDTVVVASRREEKLADVSPSVSLISSGEIETRQLRSLAEVLQTQPGVFVAGGTLSPGQHASVFTRGTESDHTSVLLDGRRLSPGLDGSSEIERYSTTGLDSVQFARGPSSTLYGVNAIGGVIDMRTTDPLALAKPAGSAEVEAGSFDTIRGAARVAGSTSVFSGDNNKKDLGVAVSGDWTDTNGPVANSDYAGNHALVRAAFRPVESLTFDTLATVHDLEFGLPGSYVAPTPDNRQWDRGWLISPGFTFDNGDDVTAKFFYSRTHQTLVYHSVSIFGPYDADTDVDTDEVSFQTDWRATGRLTLSAGYNYDRSRFGQVNTFGSNALAWESHAVWSRAVIASADKATELGAGGRYQWFDDFSDAFTGEIFASHKIAETGTKLFAKLASSYATPTAQDYFFNPPVGVLKPEEVRSWEIGVKQTFFAKTSPLEFSATYFENDMTNLIGFVTTAPFTDSSFNIGKSFARGVELGLEWRPAEQVRFFVNGTIQDARVTADSPPGTPAYATVFDGQKLARRPDYMTTFGVEFTPVKQVVIGVSGTGVMGREDTGNTDMGDYFVARVYASWRFLDNAEVFGRVENLFDADYDATGIGYRGMPLGAYAGLRLRF